MHVPAIKTIARIETHSNMTIDLSQFRKITQEGLQEPPIYRIFRVVSVHLSKALVSARISADTVTFAWVGLLLMASWLFSLDSLAASIAASSFIAIYYILDCVDGEIARATGAGSKLGSQLEQTGHWIGNGVLIAGIGLGRLLQDDPRIVLVVTAAALVGDYTFHFIFYQLNLLFNRDLDYGVLHLTTRLLYLAMPINTNLYLLFGFFGLEWHALMVWAVLSNVGWMITFGLYYRVEYMQRQLIGRESVLENDMKKS